MAEQENQQHNDVRRDDLRQQHEDGRDSTRTGSTGGDISVNEWKPGDEAAQTSADPNAGSFTGRSTNAGNGGDLPRKQQED